eukprot:SM000090S24317  [mRNA]  locus=s90:210143:210891:- [translate_table: standard]
MAGSANPDMGPDEKMRAASTAVVTASKVKESRAGVLAKIKGWAIRGAPKEAPSHNVKRVKEKAMEYGFWKAPSSVVKGAVAQDKARAISKEISMRAAQRRDEMEAEQRSEKVDGAKKKGKR